jgi:hypothetical protein
MTNQTRSQVKSRKGTSAFGRCEKEVVEVVNLS